MSIFTVKVSGTAVAALAGSVDIEDRIGERSVARVVVKDIDSELSMPFGTPVEILDDDTPTPNVLFDGYVDSARTYRLAPNGGVAHDLVLADHHYLADKRLVADAYENEVAGEIVKDLIDGELGGDGILSQEGISRGTIESGNLVYQAVFNYVPVSTALDRLAEAAGGFVWFIDDEKKLHFRSKSTVTAAWSLTAADVEGVPTLTRNAPAYRNRQWVKGGTALTDTVVEEHVGDGTAQSFTLGWPAGTAPTVKVNTVSKTVGILGLDTGKDWYWNKGSSILTQEFTDTALGSSDTLEVTYKGMFPTVAVVEDTPGVTTLAARDGSSGKVEHLVYDADLDNLNAIFGRANAELISYADFGEMLYFRTRRSGLVAGALLTVTLDDLGLSSEEFLITAVRIGSVRAAWPVWEVEAIQGPVSGSWASFFGSLARAEGKHIIRENISEEEMLVVLAGPFNESWSWAETVTQVVWSCPVPSTTQYPGTTLYPC